MTSQSVYFVNVPALMCVTAEMHLYLSLQIHPESKDYLVIFNYEFLEDFRDASARCTGPFTMKYRIYIIGN